ncbi:Uncharacterized protein TCM_040702 [Theobroma cacao]|uniref:Reverse transcriptase domain-containing protein n=1 Tax=Theobroma cacao TaxID=3641 RepID=A0A061GU62_THECC|nr:Uncharacterized protein TCM_040702 [Theobroma cacao]
MVDPSLIKKDVARHFEKLYGYRSVVAIKDWKVDFRRLTKQAVGELKSQFSEEEKFHDMGNFDERINSFFITLIPKCNNPTTLNEFGPISLVTSVYKMVAKVLTNRLQMVIGDSRQGEVFFKVDFEKAYDNVNWCFLDVMMRKGALMNKAVLNGMCQGVEIGNRGMSSLYGIKYGDGVESWASRIPCLVRSLPMTYLGLPLGMGYLIGNGANINFRDDEWMDGIILHLRRRVLGWETNAWGQFNECIKHIHLDYEKWRCTTTSQMWTHGAVYGLALTFKGGAVRVAND